MHKLKNKKLSLGFIVHLIGLHLTVAVLCVPILLVLVWLVKNVILQVFAHATDLFFNLLLPATACVLAICVSALANPMHALLSLVGVFLATVLFYVHSGIVFIGLAFLIVYVGAVAILFLFVIMLLNVKSLTSKETLIVHTTQLVAIFCGGLLAYRLFTDVADILGRATRKSIALRSNVPHNPGNITDVVYHYTVYGGPDVNAIAPLYTEHALLFGVTTLNLLLSLIGAIVLATSTTEQTVKLVPSPTQSGNTLLASTSNTIYHTSAWPAPPLQVGLHCTPFPVRGLLGQKCLGGYSVPTHLNSTGLRFFHISSRLNTFTNTRVLLDKNVPNPPENQLSTFSTPSRTLRDFTAFYLIAAALGTLTLSLHVWLEAGQPPRSSFPDATECLGRVSDVIVSLLDFPHRILLAPSSVGHEEVQELLARLFDPVEDLLPDLPNLPFCRVHSVLCLISKLAFSFLSLCLLCLLGIFLFVVSMLN